jgi:hypothetical protein
LSSNAIHTPLLSPLCNSPALAKAEKQI